METIKSATEKLQQVGYKLAEVVYSTQGAEGMPNMGDMGGAAAANPADDGPIEADYEVVDDNEEN